MLWPAPLPLAKDKGQLGRPSPSGFLGEGLCGWGRCLSRASLLLGFQGTRTRPIPYAVEAESRLGVGGEDLALLLAPSCSDLIPLKSSQGLFYGLLLWLLPQLPVSDEKFTLFFLPNASPVKSTPIRWFGMGDRVDRLFSAPCPHLWDDLASQPLAAAPGSWPPSRAPPVLIPMHSVPAP